MLALVTQIKNSTQLRWKRVHRFRAKINLHIEVGSYIIKTAQTRKELIKSFKLRHEVFNQEFRGIEKPGLDFDKFDYHFDHLIIIHRATNEIIGTYRLNCSSFSKASYTALEFDLSMLNIHKGPYLELGRACIRKDFRKGAVISLLWRGIAEYMNRCEANTLFGCSSLKVSKPREAALVYTHLVNQNFVSPEFMFKPTKKYRMEGFDSWRAYFQNGLTELQVAEAESLIPSLLKSYLKLGAKIACQPAFDEEFNCIDFLTILRKENMASSLADKYKIA